MTPAAPAATRPDVTFDDIVEARKRIAGGVFVTPCTASPALSALTGADVHCKLEYEQATGSFKERGACNALLQLPVEARRRGVIAASAGNHALALAYHGRRLGIPVTVVMPTFAPLVKQRRCAEMGARVLNSGSNIAEARVHADTLVEAEGLTYVNGFNDAAIIAGAGTIGLEMMEEVAGLDAIVAPIGGGGQAPEPAHPHRGRRAGALRQLERRGGGRSPGPRAEQRHARGRPGRARGRRARLRAGA
jgi:threonine dehydratase